MEKAAFVRAVLDGQVKAEPTYEDFFCEIEGREARKEFTAELSVRGHVRAVRGSTAEAAVRLLYQLVVGEAPNAELLERLVSELERLSAAKHRRAA